MSKDALIEMFWGDQDAVRARHSLSDALSHLRRVLGKGSIVAGQTTASLDPSASLSVDSIEFAQAVKNGNDELALELYIGPFLDGVYVDGSASFEQWVAAERHRLESLFARACARRAAVLMEGKEWDECAEVARRWLECDPASSSAARFRLEAIAGPGSRESAVRALQEFDRISNRLQTNLGIRPDAALADVARRLALRIRENELPRGHTAEFVVPSVITTALSRPPLTTTSETTIPVSTASVDTTAASPSNGPTTLVSTTAAATTPASTTPVSTSTASTHGTATPSVAIASEIAATHHETTGASKPKSRSRVMAQLVVVSAVVMLLIALVSYYRRDTSATNSNERAVVAITDFQWIRGDSAQSWMAEGLATMLASKLSRSSAIDLVAPERIREIERRAEYDPRKPLGTERARDVAVRAGANWIVSGALSKADTLLQLELTVRDVSNGKVLRVTNVSSGNVLSLADAAAARLMDVLDPVGGGARLTDIETSSQEAYQHFVAYFRNAYGISSTLAQQELDQALALDSNFVSAIIEKSQWAGATGDTAMSARLDRLFRKNEARASYWDRTTLEAQRTLPDGDIGRVVAMYRELVARYPRDPRGYTMLWNALSLIGNWKEAEQVALKHLAIDSLAVTAGNGFCTPCGAYSDLANTRLALGDGAGAEKVVRRMLELQPNLGGAWAHLAQILLAEGKYGEGLEAYRRARVLNPEGPLNWMNGQARHLVIARRLSDADTLIARLEKSSDRGARDNGLDIRALWWREKGEWKKSLDVTNQQAKEGGDQRTAYLMRGNDLAHLGDYAGAKREFEALHALYQHDRAGDYARWFSWSHTLEGDALAPSGDTTLLKILADSALLIGSNSYYARDKMAPHYLRGLVALRGGREKEAEDEFRNALYSLNGFTRVNVELSRLLISERRYDEAEKLLLAALMGPFDAMPRYQPRSEVHALLDTLHLKMNSATTR